MADRIAELEAEVERLRAELEKVRALATDTEEDSRATLFMLEDLIKSQEGLEQAKSEWEATFDAITDPLFIHDNEMNLIRANRAYLTASGGTEFRDIIGRPYYEVFPKRAGPFRICLRAQELQEEEEEFSCPITKRIFKVSIVRIGTCIGA